MVKSYYNGNTEIKKEAIRWHRLQKDMTFGELLSKYYSTCPKLVDDLMEAGMGCIGCPHSQMESIEEGAMGHGIDPDLLVAKLNATLEASQA